MKHKFQLPHISLGKYFQRTALATIALSICCSGNFLSAAPNSLNLLDGSTVSDQQQINKVQGRIIDKTGELLSGVTVTVKGSTTGTISDLDGKYSINVPDQNATLVLVI